MILKSRMIQKMEKLKGLSFKTNLGELKLKEFITYGTVSAYSASSSSDLAYFQTNIQHSKCLICNNQNHSAFKLFQQVLQIYQLHIPNLGSFACYGQTILNQNNYSYVLLVKIRKDEQVHKIGCWLTNNQILILAESLFKIIQTLKEKNIYLGDLHPSNIIQNIQGTFNVIGGFYSTTTTNKQAYFSLFPFIRSKIEDSFKYFSPEILSNQNSKIDYKSNVFVAGCIIYEIITGNYPFYNAEAVLNFQYSLEQLQLFGFQKIFQLIFCPHHKRAEPQELLKIISEVQTESCFKTTKLLMNPSQKNIKSEGFSLFDGIQKLFNKMTKQTEGAFLSFTEQNSQKPQEKFFSILITKIYEDDDRVQKIAKIMCKYVQKMSMLAKFEEGQGYFLLKTALLIYRFLREGPNHDNSIWSEIIEKITQKASSLPFVYNFCKIIKTKIELFEEISVGWYGNFFFPQIQVYLNLQTQNVETLGRYCEKIIRYIGKMAMVSPLSAPMSAVILEICNQIHNSISILVFLILAFKKDNQLQLRKDNLNNLVSTQKLIEKFLKKIDLLSQQSQTISSHPLYSLQTSYHWYQQQLYLVEQPTTSSFEYFSQQNKIYKGLQFPSNFTKKYSKGHFHFHEMQTQSLSKKKSTVFEDYKQIKKAQSMNEPSKNKIDQAKRKEIAQKKETADLSTRSQKKIGQKLQTIFEDFTIDNKYKTEGKNNERVEIDFDLNNCDIYSYDWLKSTQKSVQKLFKQPEVDAIIHFLCDDICKGLKLKELIECINKNKRFILDPSKVLFEKVIGSGSAGEVYIGKFQSNVVAIKKVKTASNPTALKEFEREVLTYLKIGKHPYLVSMIGLTKFQNDYFLLTQFCEGGSLFDLLHRKVNEIQLSWSEKRKLSYEIAKGMQSLHAMEPPILHRDLKSLNVFITKIEGKWTSKVADFGLSRCPDTALMTSALGTLHWMAPQLLQNKQYSSKIDVYSFGVVLWQICCRRTPYHNLKTPMAIVKHVVVEKQRPLLELVPKQCPEELIYLMKKCWQQHADNRPNFNEIVNFLQQLQKRL